MGSEMCIRDSYEREDSAEEETTANASQDIADQNRNTDKPTLLNAADSLLVSTPTAAMLRSQLGARKLESKRILEQLRRIEQQENTALDERITEQELGVPPSWPRGPRT